MKDRKKFVMTIALTAVLALLMAGCAQQKGEDTTSPDTTVSQSEQQTADTTSDESTTESDTVAANATVADAAESYKMAEYTTAPNEKSSVKIQYPKFSGKNSEELNKMIESKIKSYAEIDTSVFSADEALTADYQSKVTLQNENAVSIVFWGSSNMQTSAHPTTNLFTLNIDLKNMKELKLTDIYKVDADFGKIFLEKATFPKDPVTSYDEASFAEMLKLQDASTFESPDSITFFFKPDGIVLSLPAVHATGSDHLEGQLNYSDIQSKYLLTQEYWKA